MVSFLYNSVIGRTGTAIGSESRTVPAGTGTGRVRILLYRASLVRGNCLNSSGGILGAVSAACKFSAILAPNSAIYSLNSDTYLRANPAICGLSCSCVLPGYAE